MRDEPRPLEGTLARLRAARASFDTDNDYKYGLFEPGEERLVGEVVLLSRAGPGALEIGYWIDRELAGRGLATEAAAAVTRVAFEVLHVERVEIHHSAENAASAGVPKRLGFTQDATLRRRANDSDGVTRDLTVWSLFADEYPGSPASRVAIFAYDCMGAGIQLTGSI
jgi:RimJ/RimL family protein N-acetyltransferase